MIFVSCEIIVDDYKHGERLGTLKLRYVRIQRNRQMVINRPLRLPLLRFTYMEVHMANDKSAFHFSEVDV